MDTGRIGRKEAQGMDEVISQFIREMKLSGGLNRQRIFTAWDSVSGAAAYTTGKYLKNGVLYCSISSSVVRNQLFFQKDTIVMKINEFLSTDELFVKDAKGGGLVRSIVLK